MHQALRVVVGCIVGLSVAGCGRSFHGMIVGTWQAAIYNCGLSTGSASTLEISTYVFQSDGIVRITEAACKPPARTTTKQYTFTGPFGDHLRIIDPGSGRSTDYTIEAITPMEMRLSQGNQLSPSIFTRIP